MMVAMTYVREKVQPWEKYTDGEWHEVRRGPDAEPRDESLRQYRRHWESMRAWTERRPYRGQLSRTDNGRVIRARLTPIYDEERTDVPHLQPLTRAQIGRHLLDAMALLDLAVDLRMHGEGAGDTWRQFDGRAEALLRKIRRQDAK
jgi:hypothetical protein